MATQNPYSDSLLMDALRGSLSNAESLGRGFGVAPVGLLGDINALARQYVTPRLPQSVQGLLQAAPAAPTTEQILSNIPRVSKPRMETAGMEQLGAAMNPRGPVDLARGVGRVAGNAINEAMVYDRGLLAGITPQPMRMFIGAESPMYNKEAAFKASQMLKKGATPQEVWQQTGTGKYGNDFVQEISDANAKISQEKLPTTYIEGYGDVPSWKLGQALEHPELYKAYPDLAGIESSFRSGRDAYASYNPAADWISYSKEAYQKGFLSKADKEKIDLAKKNFDEFHNSPEYLAYDEKLTKAFDEGKDIEGLLNPALEKKQKEVSDAYIGQRAKLMEAADQGSTLGTNQSARSTTLHETQHAIQEREGWAKGGNADDFAKALIKQRDALNSRIEDLNQQMRGAVGTPAYEDLMSQRMEAVNELLGKKLNDPVDLLEQAQKQYESLAGEAQARSTQTRMNLTPEERLQYYPFEQRSTSNPYGLDVDPNSLVFRGGLLD